LWLASGFIEFSRATWLTLLDIEDAMLSIPKPIDVLDARALSADFFELRDLVDFVGLVGTEAASFLGCSFTDAADALGDMTMESFDLDGSAALFRCQKRAGEPGLLLDVGTSSAVREVVLDSLWEA
jgi:hypothetical protein